MNCKMCHTELTKMPEKQGDCLRCLTCKPIPKDVPKEPEPEGNKKVDVKVTEARVREIVRDELENWHINKPPVTQKDIMRITNDAGDIVLANVELDGETTVTSNEPFIMEPLNWRDQAKALNISLYHKKKEVVLAEIEEKLKVPA